MKIQHVITIPYQDDVACWNGKYFIPRLPLATRYKTRQTALAAIRNLRKRKIDNVSVLEIDT